MHETHLTDPPPLADRASIHEWITEKENTTSKTHATDVSQLGGVREVLLFVSVPVLLQQTKEQNP